MTPKSKNPIIRA